MPRDDNAHQTKQIVGLVVKEAGKLQLQPCDKRRKRDRFNITNMGGLQEGSVVLANSVHQQGDLQMEVVRVLGTRSTPGILSLISLLEKGLSEEFSQVTHNEVKNLAVPGIEGREDLRSIPLVTVDGKDTRDRDDAIFAEKTPDGGFHLIVSIADVSWYVQPGTAADKDAFERGNSTYFPDRVIPMLPEAISNGLCSINPHEDRACMSAHIWIDKDGNMKNYKFARGLMNSAAALTYEQMQAAKDGNPDSVTAPMMKTVIEPLYEAFAVLRSAREKRGAIDMDMPEHKVSVGDQGVSDIKRAARLDSHKVIEEFMVLANVAAATALESKNAPCVYRVHDVPPYQNKPGFPDPIAELRTYLSGFGLTLPPGPVDKPEAFKEVLEKAKQMPEGHLIAKAIARVQAKAAYSSDNIGHFGLALERYAHFTSPIRRYADLLVHRSLADAFNMGAGGLTPPEKANIEEMAGHVSETEKLSTKAERSAHDRFSAAYYEKQVGKEFTGRIVNVTNAGLFIRLDASGTDGLLPMGMLRPKDFYELNKEEHKLVGKNTGHVFHTGDTIKVRLKDADALLGSITLKPANDNTPGVPFTSVVNTPRPPNNNQKHHRRRPR
jgi:ribonuclease R